MNSMVSPDACDRTALHAWHDAELSTRAAAVVADHVARCPQCQNELRWLQALETGVHALRRDRLRRAHGQSSLSASRPQTVSPRSGHRRFVKACGVAAMLCVLLPAGPSSRGASPLQGELHASLLAAMERPTDPELMRTAALARRVQQLLREDAVFAWTAERP